LCFVLKEWFTLGKFLFLPTGFYAPAAHVTEQSAVLNQSVTDEHWGADCSKMMEAILVHTFDRHFQIVRTTIFRGDMLLTLAVEWSVAEKTGNIKHCIEINDRKYQTMESYMRAAPPPAMEVAWFLCARGSFVGVEAHHQHLQPRQNLLRLLEYAGITNTQQAEEGYRSCAEWAYVRTMSASSADGLHHMHPNHAVVAGIRALFSFSVRARNVDLSWLDDLPPADATTLHDVGMSKNSPVMARVLIAEVFEQQGRHADALRFAQTDLQDYHNLNVPSKVRAGRVLGRCHAALGSTCYRHRHSTRRSSWRSRESCCRRRRCRCEGRGRAAAGTDRDGDGLQLGRGDGEAAAGGGDWSNAGAAGGAVEGVAPALILNSSCFCTSQRTSSAIQTHDMGCL
jgi:hypothetical protein